MYNSIGHPRSGCLQ